MVETQAGTWTLPALGTLLAQAGGAAAGGGYFSIVKILVMLVVPIPLLILGPKIHRDAGTVHASQATWSVALLLSAIVGLLLWLLLPFYVVGLIFYVVLTTGAMFAYVAYRNSRVPAAAKILTADHIREVLTRGQRRKQLAVHTKLKVYRGGNKMIMPPTPENNTEEEIRAYNRTQELLYDMIWKRASEADISPVGQEARVRYVIDGVIQEQPSLELTESEEIIEYLKPMGNMDPEERRRPQEGMISVDLAGKPIDIEMTAAGTTGGQRMQFRVVQEVVQTDLGQLGMNEDLLEKVRRINHGRKGLLIVSGPPRSGVTSTLYSLLREHDAFMQQLATLEAEAEVDMENVTQQEYGEAEKLPNALAGVLRRDPDVIVVDQCPDRRTAELILDAAGEKLVLLGARASDSFTALAKWVRTAEDPAAAARDLHGVLCQTLLRKLCPACKEAYRPDPQMLAKINIPPEKIENFYRVPTEPLTDEKGRPRICATCQGVGYYGRTAAFELLEVTDEIRNLIAQGTSLTQLKNACRKSKMLYLQEQALKKVIAGETSVQEVVRVSQKSAKKSSKKAS